jgi:hypothetical protein
MIIRANKDKKNVVNKRKLNKIMKSNYHTTYNKRIKLKKKKNNETKDRSPTWVYSLSLQPWT